jgi:hypothetical protein
MKTKHFMTSLLVVLFAVGIPVGVLSGGGSYGTDPARGLVREWPNEGNGGWNMWEIQGPLDTGTTAQAGKEISQSTKRFQNDASKVVERGVFKYRIGIDDGP